MQTDDYVDVLTVGSGRAGSAAAIAAVDAGLTVFVADAQGDARPSTEVAAAPQTWTALLQERWQAGELHRSTVAYLDNLTRDLGGPTRPAPGMHLPITAVAGSSTAGPPINGSTQPFYGADLQRWARDCLCAPYSLVFGRVSSATMAELSLPAGGCIRATVVAPLPQEPDPTLTLDDWLSRLSAHRGIKRQAAHTLQRLLFSGGKVRGAVLDTPDGPRVVRARRGVLIGTSATPTDVGMPLHPEVISGTMRLCLVSRTASRFARLEYVTGEPVTEVRRPDAFPISRPKPASGSYRPRTA